MLQLGDVVKLKVRCLKNDVGALGIVFEEYKIGEYAGCEIIFENGNYDGFDEDEQDKFLEFIRHCDDFDYTFTNVMQVSRDFEEGFFIDFIGKKTLVRIDPKWMK